MRNATRRPGVTSDIGPFAIVPMWLIDAGVSGNALRLFTALAGWYTDRDTGKAHPSRSTLAKRIGVSTATVDRAAGELAELGAIAIEPRFERSDGEASGRQTSNVYTLRFVQPPLRESDDGDVVESEEHPVVESDEPGTRIIRDQSQKEPDLPAATDYDPLVGRRIDGQDLAWNALASVIDTTEQPQGSRMVAALRTIRATTWEYARETRGLTVEQVQDDPAKYEDAVARTIELVGRRLREGNPGLTWGPEGIARHFARGLRAADSRATTAAIVDEVLDDDAARREAEFTSALWRQDARP